MASSVTRKISSESLGSLTNFAGLHLFEPESAGLALEI